MAIFYILMVAFPSKPTVILASTLMGDAFGNGFSYYYTDGTIIVPESRITLSVGIITALQGLAMGLATYFATFLMHVLKTERITPTFKILGIIEIIGTVYAITAALRSTKS